jgi:ketosteroid isomerase-like protein
MLQTTETPAAKATITAYFERLFASGWEALIDDDIVFRSPSGETRGRAAYVAATNGFKRAARSVDVIQLIVEGEDVSATTSYQLQSPNGDVARCEVVEVFSVSDGKIQSSRIYFDTAAFAKFMGRG